MLRHHSVKRIVSGLGAFILIAGIAAQVFLPGTAHAAAQQIEPRSLTLQTGTSDINSDGINDGGSMPSAIVTHLFNFTIATAASETVGSISFQYCTTADAVPGGINCDAPAGVDVTSATLSTDGGSVTGFTVKTPTTQCDNSCPKPNVITIGLSSAATGVTNAALTKAFSGVVNPSTANQTFFVRIYTYAGTTGGTLDPTDASVEDYGNVAASTASPIVLQGQMPESLVFCTGRTIGETNGVPDCTTATTGSISFNQLFSPVSTAVSTSQMAASTNASQGYAITVGGPTLTSGSNTINAMATTAQSQFGVSQFGLNLVANDGTAYTNAPKIDATTLPAVTPAYAPSAPITPTSGSTATYNGQVLTGFATNGSFTFNDAALNTVADSGYNTSPDAPKGTDAQIYTVSYIANVPGSQPAGTYTTTLTYICTPTF